MSSIKSNKSWGGRFATAPSSLLKEYTDSQHYDRELYAEDIEASKAHALMLGKTGIITGQEAELIINGLDKIWNEIEADNFVWKEDLEDVHMNIEARLVELIGETGKKLHTARSRNDQVAVDFHLYVSRKCDDWKNACIRLCEILYKLAKNNQSVILPGLTHMQPAQPVSLAQYLLAFANMFKRDAERIEDAQKRIRVSPLGACALAGTTYNLNPFMTAEILDFKDIYSNSMDAVSDRDFVLEAQFIASVIMMHLSRLCEEMIIFANPAFSFIGLPDAYSTGSSIMPQKKNPDVMELMRGKTGRVYGNLVSILTIMKGLPLTYNRDLQEDKESFFDSSDTVLSSLKIMSSMLPEITFNKDAMYDACSRGYLNATELADYLVNKGFPFRESHHITGQIVAWAEKEGLKLEDLSLEQFQALEKSIEKDVFQVLDYNNCIKRRESAGGTGPLSVKKQLEDFATWLNKYNIPL